MRIFSALPTGTTAADSRFEPGTSRLRVHGLNYWAPTAPQLWIGDLIILLAKEYIKLFLIVCTCCCEDFAAVAQTDVDGCLPHPTRAGVDEHSFSFPHLPADQHRVVHGGVDHRYGSRLFQRPRVRTVKCHMFGGFDGCRQSLVVQDTHHAASILPLASVLNPDEAIVTSDFLCQIHIILVPNITRFIVIWEPEGR